MPKAIVFFNNIKAGILEKTQDGSYTFLYDKEYLQNNSYPAVSMTLPKIDDMYRSKYMFSFFFGLLSEGNLAKQQCRALRLDENDYFSRLVKTCSSDTIGAIRVVEVSE